MKKIKILIACLFLFLAILSCSLPGNTQSQAGSQNGTMTSVAATVIAEFASPAAIIISPVATDQPVVPAEPVNSPLPAIESSQTPTSTIVPTASNTALPCNRAQFINDVTIPDDTNMKVNKSFTKVWRLQNTGSCPWTSGYLLVFDHGDLLS
ncbi:MAG: NBR1-Ig-like domain-containing protein, partial [Chloroflexota bacterium]